MSKLPNFWQFFNLTSQPTIPSLYWDSYSYEERIKKICDKIWSILNYLKLVMELLNEFDDRLEALEELYNNLEARVAELERLYNEILARLDAIEARLDEIERLLAELDLDEILAKLNAILSDLARPYAEDEAWEAGEYCIYNNYFYRCNTDIPSPGEEWNPAHWTLTNIGDELIHVTEDIELKDVRNVKFPEGTSANPVTINSFFPLIFKSNERNGGDGYSGNTNPYVVGAAGVAIKSLSEQFGSGTGYLAPQSVSNPSIIYGDGSSAITLGGKDYVIGFYLCDGNGNTIAFTVESTSNIAFVLYHNITSGWKVHVDDFTEAADETSAATYSAANPNRIYYVVETPTP